jgi:glucose/arabinose dehydrogenase
MERPAIPVSRLAILLLSAALGASACGAASGSPSAGTSASGAPPGVTASPLPAVVPQTEDTSREASSATASPSGGASGGLSPSAAAGDRPDLAAANVELETVVDGLDQPVFVTSDGTGNGRHYIAEQPGRIQIVENGATLPSPFLDITDRVTSGGERGLLGLAFPPGFGRDHDTVYVHYSGKDGATTISEFRVGLDADALDPESERVILTEPQPYPNHNGGWIGFDRDGMLLIALGDGGSGGDPENRASNLKARLGKILRIDVLAPPAGQPYGIPADNPWVQDADILPEILHSGLRNPFRDSIDPATGNLWIGDVGQNAWEEVDVARAGARGLDFGWRRWEGNHCYNPSSGCDPSGVTKPVAEYGHDLGCSVIGGPVYRGSAIPALRGAYLFSDYCSGTLWGLDSMASGPQTPVVLLESKARVSSIVGADDGAVFLTDLGTGRLLRLVAGG